MKACLANLRHTIFAATAVAMVFGAANAAVVSRGSTSATTTARPTSSRPQAVSAARMPTMAPQATTTTSTTTSAAPTNDTPDTTASTTTDTTPATPDIVLEDKSARFAGTVGTGGVSSATDTAADSLAELIRRQRAAMDADTASTAARNANAQAMSGIGGNACDNNLRACMQSKCGNDFSKCAGDTDTLWGTKMDACRRDLPCTPQEYRLFAAEIKADRDMNARLASYNAILDCGNNYNDCIVAQCGVDYSKCLGKTAGDAAISACATIARNCAQQDSGLAARTMDVFATLRQTAEVQIARDEQRLYALRDEMRSVCARLGAMFDERSLDCVYTVEFYADAGSTLYASKKSYAGSVFDCDPNWFGIDITTFRENAYRRTRDQEAATMGMLGAGAGMAVGSLTSGVVSRAVDRQRAERALNDAKAEAIGLTATQMRAVERCAKNNKNGRTGVKKNKLGMWVCYNPETGAEDATGDTDDTTAQTPAQPAPAESGDNGGDTTSGDNGGNNEQQ